MMMHKRVLDIGGLAADREIMSALGNKAQRARGALVYQALWAIAEPWGGYEPDYKIIAKQLGHLDFSTKEVKKFTEIFISLKKVITYVTDGGRELHWLKNFLKHQRMNTPSPPSLPLPPWITASLKKYNNGRTFATFEIHEDKLPADCMQTAGGLHAVNGNGASGLHAESVRTREGEGEGDSEGERERQYKKSGGPSAPPLPEKEKFEAAREHLERQCQVLMQHFGISKEFDPREHKPSNGRFHPLGFLYYAAKGNIPVEVQVKVIDRMVEEKENIINPYGWITSVLEREWSQHNYAEELRAHEDRKRWGIEPIKNFFKGFTE